MVDPSQRLTAKEALEHPWLTELTDDHLAERDLTSTKKGIARFNAKRRFKAAVDAVSTALGLEGSRSQTLDGVASSSWWTLASEGSTIRRHEISVSYRCCPHWPASTKNC